MITTKEPPAVNKSNKPPITKKHKKRMADYLIKLVKSFPTKSVTESLVTFSERVRVLVAGTSARPGPYRFSVVPYLREVAECLSEFSRIIELILMKGTQTGGTEIMMNHELYCIEYGIGPVLYMTSDDGLASEHSSKRIDPMISAAGMLYKITPPVQKRSNKATGDTVRSKSYGGTFLRCVGARSESKLSSLPNRILHIDEIDKFLKELIGGGASVEKATRRADSYGNLKKIFYISTPKRKHDSRIEPLFQQGDMRYYNIKCPECGTMQRLKWSNMKWEKDEDGNLLIKYDEDGNALKDPTWMQCDNPDCDRRFLDHEKVFLLQEDGHGGDARWIATKKPDRPNVRSYHISALYGFRSWLDIVIQWERIQGDLQLLEDFITDVLGETFEQKIDKPDEHYLASRAEADWVRGQVNERIKTLHLGADIHPDRIECAIIGYTDRKEAWAVDYHVFPGTIIDPTDKCWDSLEEVIKKEYHRTGADGAAGESIWIQTALIDMRYEKESVLNFCERFPYQQNSLMGVFPCVGVQNQSEIVKWKPSTIGVPEITMDDQRLKFEIYTSLKRKAPATGNRYPGGYIHFPADYHEDYYKQMVAEDVIPIVDSRGFEKMMIVNEKQRRNEVLDCTKMALAGLYFNYIAYFKIWNSTRKLKKQKEILPDWALYWSLFGDDRAVEAEAEEENKK